jgi:hypothetical protein
MHVLRAPGRTQAINWPTERVAATTAQLDLVLLVAQSNTHVIDWTKLARHWVQKELRISGAASALCRGCLLPACEAKPRF